jgi:integrase
MPNYPGKRAGTRRIVVWVRGKPHEKTIRGTKREGDTFEARYRIELEANQHDVTSAPRFVDLVTRKYSPFARANFAESTWRARSHVLVNLCEFFGKKKLTEFTMADTEAYKAHRRSPTVGPSTINGELRSFLSVLAWAERNGYQVTFPPVRYLRVPMGRVRLWTRDEVLRLLSVTRAEHPELLPLVLFLVNTGCRKGESIAAEWSWVDFEHDLVRIPASREWSPKSGRAREVPLSSALRKALSIPTEERRSERWIFVNRDRGRYEFFPDAIFKELQTKAGIAGGPHVLRHSYASEFLARGGKMTVLSEILGHSHLRTTSLYSHLVPGLLAEARDVVNIGPPTMGMAKKTRGRARKTA